MLFLSTLISDLRSVRLPAVAAARPSVRLSLTDQWNRLVALVSEPIERTQAGLRYHSAAENQIDAATYALNEIAKDLAAVMRQPIPRPAMAIRRVPRAMLIHERHRLAAVAA